MSITDITQAPGFNQQQYNQLLESARSLRVDVSMVDSKLLAEVNNGKSFDEALKLLSSDLPKLASPNAYAFDQLKGWIGAPAPGALVMALVTELSAQQREQNREMMWAETEAIAKSMKDQAKEMRTMAGIQLAMGLTSAAINIASGVAQAKIASGPGNGMLLAAKAQGVGKAIGGGAEVFGSINQFVGSMYQAKFKEMEADQEKMRTFRESLKDFNDGLKELIQKSLSSQESIPQGKNQATTRILA